MNQLYLFCFFLFNRQGWVLSGWVMSWVGNVRVGLENNWRDGVCYWYNLCTADLYCILILTKSSWYLLKIISHILSRIIQIRNRCAELRVKTGNFINIINANQFAYNTYIRLKAINYEPWSFVEDTVGKRSLPHCNMQLIAIRKWNQEESLKHHCIINVTVVWFDYLNERVT